MINSIFNYVKSLFINRSVRSQRNSGLHDPGLWDIVVNDAGRLAVAGRDVTDLVASYGSPLLVVNQRQLHKDAGSIQKAVEQLGNGSRVFYSYKTNCIPGILKDIHEIGIGAEVISPYELWLAERLGVAPDDTIYNGVNKTEESLVRAVERGILSTNIDSLIEIDRIVDVARRLRKKARVGIRLGFSPKSQFGMEIETGEAMEACRRILQYPDLLELNTLHFNVVSNVNESGTHRFYATKSLEFIHAMKQCHGVNIRYLDIGGGIGVPTSKNMSGAEYGLYRVFDCLPEPPDPTDFENIETFVARVGATVRDVSARLHLEVPSIIMEPGRFVTSRSEFLLTTVLDVKKKGSGPRFAITDAGRLSLTFPCDFEYHATFLADQRRPGQQEPYHVMGRICTSADWLAKNLLLPQLRSGDVLATMDAGAYFSSNSSTFAFPRPAIIMVDEQGGVEVLRHEESFEHMVAMDTVFQ